MALPDGFETKDIRVPVNTYFNFEGSIDDVVSRLQKQKTQATKDGFTDLKIEWDYGYHPDDSDTLKITGIRTETEAETIRRVNRERSAAAVLAASKQRQYENLKRELGYE